MGLRAFSQATEKDDRLCCQVALATFHNEFEFMKISFAPCDSMIPEVMW